jgi:hypothetical protein
MKYRGFLAALMFSGSALAAVPENASADYQFTGNWLRAMTVEGEEPDLKDNAGCTAFLRSGAYDPLAHAEANLKITPNRMETNEEGSDVTGNVAFGATKATLTPFSIKAEHEDGVADRAGFIEQHDSDYISITIQNVQVDDQGTKGDVVRRYCRQ